MSRQSRSRLRSDGHKRVHRLKLSDKLTLETA